MRSRTLVARLTVGMGLVTTTLLAGCTGSSHGASSSGGDRTGDVQANAVATGLAAGPKAPNTAAGAPPTGDAPDSAPVLGRQLIETTALTVQVDDVKQAETSVYALASGAGAQVTGDVRADVRDAAKSTADLTLSVPQTKLDAVLVALDGLGAELSRNSSTKDVTGQTADVNSRVAAAQASIGRLEDLFTKAATVADVVAIENDLAQREADLESLEATQRALASETAAATVTLHLVATAPVVVKPAAYHDGFVSGLKTGWHAFSTTAGVIFTAVGAALPFLVAFTLLGSLALLGYRRRPRRPAAVAPNPIE